MDKSRIPSAGSSTSTWEALSQHVFDMQLQVNSLQNELQTFRAQLQESQSQLQALEQERYQHSLRLGWLEQLVQRLHRVFRADP